MLKKLIHFASNIIKPGPSSNDLGPSSEEDLEAPRLQSSLEYQPELGNAISPGSDAELAQSSRSDMTSVSRSVSDRDISSQISHLNTEATATTDLDTLYRSLPLNQGMLYIAESLASATEQTYLPKTAQWLGESDFQRLGTIAITAKRQGDYAKAMTVFNEFAQDCPYYYQIHHSTMKILGASGDLEAALKALQLWCVAIIPEKILRLPALNNQLPDGKWPISVEQLTYLAGWAIADTKSMYHLGSLQMMVSG